MEQMDFISSIFVRFLYRLFNVLCWLWHIFEGAKLPSVYFITSTKHYLALTQLFHVLLTSRFHIVKYTHCVALPAFCCISFRSLIVISCFVMDAFTWDKLILLAAFVRFYKKNIYIYICEAFH